jgi:hypothetical protein
MTPHQMDALQPLHTIKPRTYIYQNARSLFKQIHWSEFELINKALKSTSISQGVSQLLEIKISIQRYEFQLYLRIM